MAPGAASGTSAAEGHPTLLSWSAGQPLPQQDGRMVPAPVEPPIACSDKGADCESYHWFAGGWYNSSSGQSDVNRTFGYLDVPRGPANSHQFYYVLVSIFDDSGSYDQLGFSDDNGVWGLTESYTTGSCTDPTYWFVEDAKTLEPDRYLFEIDITGGLIHFLVGTNLLDLGSVWNDTESPGVKVQYLLATPSYCDTYYAYTLYEEVYSSNATDTPTYDFNFRDWKIGPQAGMGSAASFEPFYDAVSTSDVEVTVPELYGNYNNVAIDNDPN
jgi:hypothetical protein